MRPSPQPNEAFGRELLQRLRAEHQPPAGAAVRGLAVLRARLGHEGDPGASELGGQTAGAPGWTLALAVGGGVAALATAAALGLGLVADPVLPERVVPPPPPVEPAVVADAVVAPRPHPPVGPVEPLRLAHEVPTVPATPARSTAKREPKVRPEVRHEVAPAPRSEGVERELALVNPARRALAAGDPRRALVLLSEHAAQFPTGFLAEEREVLRISALCEAGSRAAARGAARAFLDAHPRSKYAKRVLHTCSDGGGSTRTSAAENP